MPVRVSEADLQLVVDEVERSGGNKEEAARRLRIAVTTVKDRLKHADRLGMTPSPSAGNPNDPAYMRGQIRRLNDALKKAEQEALDHTIIREKILQLKRNVSEVEIPDWMAKPDGSHSKPGVPTVFVSDLHWAEVVDGKQINGVNRYNLEIARQRMERLVDRTVRLCEIVSPNFDYPGIVVPFGGDMLSGNIHEELTATNEVNSMPALLDLFEVLAGVVKYFRKTFGRVFLPCVTGNHGRDCYDFETEILTERGWLRIDEIDRERDAVAVYMPGQDNIRFERPKGWFYDSQYSGEMVSVESKGVSLLVTPEHTLWVKGASSTHVLKGGVKRYEYPFAQRPANERAWSDAWTAQCAIDGWVGEVKPILVEGTARTLGFTIEPSVLWAEFFGWYVSEGSSENDRITISQSATKNKLKRDRIVEVISELGFKPSPRWNMVRFGSAALSRFLDKEFGHLQKDRRIPVWLKMWPKELLLAFFNAAMKGDGCWEKRGGTSGRYTSTSDQLHDDMQEVAFKLGYATNLGERYTSPFGDSGYVGTARHLGVVRTKHRSMTRSKIVHYSGPIWCPTVSSGLVVVRRRGKVVISGNTKKIWSKDRHHTSFDWLLYCFLSKHFQEDKNITFLIPDGSDAYYQIYNHSYLLSHGDQFRGGDGVIGPLGPIIRGDHRKRSRNMQINMAYDTLIMGHWHQYIQLQRLIVNGSLKGYDEYAWTSNFPFEPPQQALWLTHPKYGITYRMPVQVEQFKEAKVKPWVSIAA